MPHEEIWPPKPDIPEPASVIKGQPKWVFGLGSIVFTFFPMTYNWLVGANQCFWYHRHPRPLDPLVQPLTEVAHYSIPIVGMQAESLLPIMWLVGLVCGIIARHSLFGKIGMWFAVLTVLSGFLPVWQ